MIMREAFEIFSILPGRSKRVNEPLAGDEIFTLRSGLGAIMRIARISRPRALYGASVDGRTSETIGGESVVNPIDCAEVFDVHLARAADAEIIHICLVLTNSNKSREACE